MFDRISPYCCYNGKFRPSGKYPHRKTYETPQVNVIRTSGMRNTPTVAFFTTGNDSKVHLDNVKKAADEALRSPLCFHTDMFNFVGAPNLLTFWLPVGGPIFNDCHYLRLIGIGASRGTQRLNTDIRDRF